MGFVGVVGLGGWGRGRWSAATRLCAVHQKRASCQWQSSPVPRPPPACSSDASSSGGAAAGGTAPPARRLEVGVWKTVEAHSKGQMTALAAHPSAPLLATATNNQVRGERRCGGRGAPRWGGGGGCDAGRRGERAAQSSSLRRWRAGFVPSAAAAAGRQGVEQQRGAGGRGARPLLLPGHTPHRPRHLPHLCALRAAAGLRQVRRRAAQRQAWLLRSSQGLAAAGKLSLLAPGPGCRGCH